MEGQTEGRADAPQGEESGVSRRCFDTGNDAAPISDPSRLSPEAAVRRLAKIVCARHEFSEDDIYSAMRQAGMPDAPADRAFKFTQIAWGRAVLIGLGVQLCPEYICLNASGDVVESGRLEQQPYFVAAAELVAQYSSTPGFQRLARMSSDFCSINQAMINGSKPADLVTGPPIIFLEPPTPSGMARAQEVLAARLQSIPKRAAAGKPWWRLW